MSIARITIHDEQGTTTMIAEIDKNTLSISYIAAGCDMSFAYNSLDSIHRELFDSPLSATLFSKEVKKVLVPQET